MICNDVQDAKVPGTVGSVVEYHVSVGFVVCVRHCVKVLQQWFDGQNCSTGFSGVVCNR
jgi:hypothetical protein